MKAKRFTKAQIEAAARAIHSNHRQWCAARAEAEGWRGAPWLAEEATQQEAYRNCARFALRHGFQTPKGKQGRRPS